MIDELISKAAELWEADVKRRTVRRGSRAAARGGFTVADLPPSERPRERLSALGAGALSQQELLACILGRGFAGESVMVTAQRLLRQFGSLDGIERASFGELSRVRGVGPAKAAQLMAACELGRRVESAPPSNLGRPVNTVGAATAIARRHLARRKKEYFIALLLDSRHRVTQVIEVSVGSLNMSVVHPRETFREAIAAGAAAMIVAHNHPSGDPAPSPEDLELTHRLVEAGRLLGIPVLDHLIIAEEGNLSLRDRGFLEESR